MFDYLSDAEEKLRRVREAERLGQFLWEWHLHGDNQGHGIHLNGSAKRAGKPPRRSIGRGVAAGNGPAGQRRGGVARMQRLSGFRSTALPAP